MCPQPEQEKMSERGQVHGYFIQRANPVALAVASCVKKDPEAVSGFIEKEHHLD